MDFFSLLQLPPLRFHCVGGCWDQTQDRCDIRCSNHSNRSHPPLEKHLLTRGGKGAVGGGAKSTDGEKTWSALNHSILSEGRNGTERCHHRGQRPKYRP
jgi:hypothetical protein